MSSIQEKLKEMAQLTMLTGKLSDYHFQNMKRFPFIVFNGLKTVSMDYVIGTSKENESLIKYTLSLDLEQNDQLDKRFKALESYLRNLFWKEVKLEVVLDGETKFKSE